MALPPTFTSRVRGSVVPLAPRRIAPSGVADALSVLGRAGANAVARDEAVEREQQESEFRIAQEEQRRERSRRAVAFGAQLAEARIAYQERAIEERANTEPGAPGWANRSRELVAEIFAPLASTFADDEELANTLAPQLQSVTASIVSQEIEWEARQRTTWEGEQFEVALQGEADGVLGEPTPEKAAEALDRIYDLIALTDHPGTIKGQLAVLARRRVMGSLLDGMGQAGQYDQMAALLESGTLDGLLGDDKDNYLRVIEAGRQAQAREAEIAASEQRDGAREALRLIKVQIENGDFVPQSRITAAINEGQAAGMPADELAGYAYLGEEMVNARQFQGMSDAVLQDEIAALQQLESAGRIDPAQKRRLDQAEKALGGRDQAKGDSLSTLWKSGPEGQQQAVAQLADMPPERAWAAASRAGLTRAAVYARLSANGQREAIEGAAVRKVRGDDFLPKRQNKADKKLAEQTFRAIVGDGLVRQLGGAFGDVFETALDVMAGTGGEWSEGNFRRSVQAVFGASRRPDGTLQGGIGQVRGRTVELPADMTASEFDRYLSRVTFAEARYAGGQAANKLDVLSNFLPVPLSERGADGVTRYGFVDAQDRPLMHASGGRFIIPVRR